LPSLQERLDPNAEVQTFNDSEALEALDHIIRTKPVLVAMEDEFSATSRGLALINRIKDDPNLGGVEVRVMARNAAQNRVAVKRGKSGTHAVAVVEPKKALDQRGTRRALRSRIKDGVEIAVDGNPAALVDLSTVGAQVVSPTVLKPNQRVRVALTDDHGALRFNGAIAWAAFEIPPRHGPQYRAGVNFVDADSDAVGAFCMRHKQS